MNKLLRFIFAQILLAPVFLWAQAPVITQQITFPISQNLQPASATVTRIGNPGNATYFYWTVPNYLIGAGSPYFVGNVLGAASTLSGTNYNQVSPNYPLGIVSVDVLRTSIPFAPSGACNCAVATGITSGVINDQSNSLNSYTVSPVNVNALNITLDNEPVGAGQSHLIYRQNGVQVADLSIGGGSSPISTVFGRTGAVTGQSGDYSIGQITGAPTSVFGRTGAVVATSGDYSVGQITGAAPLASPALTGAPSAPTPTAGDSTTKLATTAFFLAPGPIGSTTPNTGSFTKLNNVFLADRLSGLTADVKLNTCITSAELNGPGGICDARGLVGNQTVAATVAIGNVTPTAVTLLLGTGVDYICTMSGTPCFSQYSGTTIKGDGQGTNMTQITLGSGAAPTALLVTLPDTAQGLATHIFDQGLEFTGNTAASSTVTDSLVDLQGVFDSTFASFTVGGSTTSATTILLHIHDLNSVVGFNSVHLPDLLLDGSHAAGARDLVIDCAFASCGQNVDFGGRPDWGHPGVGQYVFEFNGNGHELSEITIPSLYVESNSSDTTTALGKLRDVQGVAISNYHFLREPAGSTVYAFDVSESSPALLNGLRLCGTITGGTGHNAVNDHVLSSTFLQNQNACYDPLYSETSTGGNAFLFGGLLLKNDNSATLSGQFVSTLATGTAPFSISSTTAVANLTLSNHPRAFEAGTLTTAEKIYTNTQALTAGAATHTFANSFTFTSSSTFGCTCTDQTAVNACKAVPASATTVTLAGTGTDTLWLSCSGH